MEEFDTWMSEVGSLWSKEVKPLLGEVYRGEEFRAAREGVGYHGMRPEYDAGKSPKEALRHAVYLHAPRALFPLCDLWGPKPRRVLDWLSGVLD